MKHVPALLLVLSLTLPASLAQRASELNPRSGLPNVLAKLAQGKDVRIAYLGGSITAAGGWRVLSLQWFQQQFPQAHPTEIDAALSGTGSTLGAFRIDHDVLRAHPDLVFVEFAVNDHGFKPEQVREAMEGIVRKIWRADPTTDICFIYTLTQDDLSALESGNESYTSAAMEQVAKHYDIPSINFGVAVAKRVKEGTLLFKGQLPATIDPTQPMIFSGDGTHPYERTGHTLYLESFARSINALRAVGSIGPHLVPKPLDVHNLEIATVVPLTDVSHTGNWQPVTLNDETDQLPRSLPNVFAASKPGDGLSFDFDGTLCGLYGVKGPDAAQFTVAIDRDTPISTTLFDSFSTAHRYRIRPWFSPSLKPGHHHVVITIAGVVSNKEAILHAPTAGDPEFDRSVLYIGSILINGTLLPTR